MLASQKRQLGPQASKKLALKLKKGVWGPEVPKLARSGSEACVVDDGGDTFLKTGPSRGGRELATCVRLRGSPRSREGEAVMEGPWGPGGQRARPCIHIRLHRNGVLQTGVPERGQRSHVSDGQKIQAQSRAGTTGR